MMTKDLTERFSMQVVRLESLTGGELSVAKLGRVLNFGCGTKLVKDAVNADAFVEGEGITPIGEYGWDFEDNSFDAVVSFKVLEHTRTPARIVSLIHRVLKPGRPTWNSIAFCEHYHQYPKHYYNIAPDGMRSLFRKFKNVKVFTCPCTPPSELCYLIRHWRDAARLASAHKLTIALDEVLKVARAHDKMIQGNEKAMEALFDGAPGLVVRGTKPHG